MTSHPILITGAAGFAGSHLLDLLEPTDVPLVGWRRPGEPLPAPPTGTHVRWIEVDLVDEAAVRAGVESIRPSAVYHLAGIAQVGDSWNQSASTLQVNVLGTYHLLTALASLVPVPRALVTGSALVYAPQPRALGEDDPIRPGSPYGISKLAQELTGVDVARTSGLPVLLTRSFPHIGPRQAPSFFTASVARQIARIELGLLPPVVEVGNLDTRRDVTDVRDTVRAYRTILERGRAGTVYNVCAGQAYRTGDLLSALVGLARVPIEVRVDPARYRPHDEPLVLGDRGRIGRELGWAPEIPIERTLADVLDYWRAVTSCERRPATESS